MIPLPPGANSPMNAGVINQQNQINAQMNLIGSSKGGAPVVQVPPVSSVAPNPELTGNNFKNLTQLAQQQQTDASFDNAKTPQETAAIQHQQQSLYKSGGYKRKRTFSKRGGSWPKWGCLSGGRKTKRKGRKERKGRKGRKSKRHN
jgi:hypothetical protein